MGVAWVFKRVWIKSRYQPLMLELPPYRRAGPAQSCAWAVGSAPTSSGARGRHHLRADGGAVVPVELPRLRPPMWTWQLQARRSATASRAGSVRPCSMCSHRSASTGRSRSRWYPGWQRARVAVGALGTVYSMSAAGGEVADALAPVDRQGLVDRDPRTRCSPGTYSRRNASRRSRWSSAKPIRGAIRLLMALYQFVLAYVAAFATYRITLLFGA